MSIRESNRCRLSSLGPNGSNVSSPNGSGTTSTPTSYGAMVNLDGLLQELGLVPGTNYDLSTLSEKQEIESSSSYTGVDDFVQSNSECQGDTTCLCEADPYWAQLAGYDCAQEQIMYWYHPDYLGNTELITDVAGRPYQYFLYTPWGEVLESQRQWGDFYDTRYRFNAKEWDAETGNYYYGARYYDPKVSTWLSVDPLTDKYPSLSPYNYVENNPVNLIDPDGRSATCPTCPDEKEFDLFKESEVEFTYNEKNDRVEKATNDKLNIEEAKDPHLETLTFLKYTMQGDEGNDNTMTDYFNNPNAEGGYGITEVEQKVDGLNLKMTIVNDNSYPTAGGTIEYKSEKGFEGTGANGPSSRLRTILKSGYLEGATPNEGVELLNISYPYSQKGAKQQKKDASYY